MPRPNHGAARIVLALLTLVVACGGWDDDYLDPARLDGRLEGELDASAAWAAVRIASASGASYLVAEAVDEEGRFTIEGIPANVEVELLASTGRGRAHRSGLRLYGGRDNPRTFASEPGATLVGTVSLEGDARGRTSNVGFTGLPVLGRADEAGQFSIEGLPWGEFELWAEHYGHRRSRTQVALVAGESQRTSLHLLAETGMDLGGLCAPCESGAQCTSGACVVHEHEGFLEQVCAKACGAGEACGAGYECESGTGGSWCMPTDATCEAVSAIGATCRRDEECGGAAGVCWFSRCTLACSEDDHCPSGSCVHVQSGATELGVCQP